MIHVDTNFLIALEHPANKATGLLREWLVRRERMGLCCLVWTEYLCGPLTEAKTRAAEVLFPRPEPYLASDASVAARLFNHTGHRRGTVVDCMIAAVAVRCGAPLATLNPKDFARFASMGLTVIDATG